MKEVILSADGDSVVYLVPDVVAENLREYCIEFSYNWQTLLPGAKYFDESDFIRYLNERVFPDQKSVLVKNLGYRDCGQRLPRKYRNHPNFNF